MNYRILNAQVDTLLREVGIEDGVPDTQHAGALEEEAIRCVTETDKGPTLYQWENFNRMFGAFRPNEFTVLCGSTGAGKTTFLANISSQLMTTSVPHIVASVETGPIDYLLRLVSVLEGRDINFGDPIAVAEARAMFEKWGPILRRKMLHLCKYTNKVNPRRVLCDLLHARKEFGARVALIDNLNFLMPIVSQNESNSTMDRTIHDFVVFCKAVDMHIVMVMHPKKRQDNTNSVRVDNEYDIKGSSTVVQESHNVLLLNRPTKEQTEAGYEYQTHREIKFAKLRRRGKYAGQRIMFEGVDTRYYERAVLT